MTIPGELLFINDTR